MKPFLFWLRPERFVPVKFYPYTSIVTHVLYESRQKVTTSEHFYVQHFAKVIKEKVKEMGMEWDNKVVVEIASINMANDPAYKTSTLFIGYKDGRITIGLGVWKTDDSSPHYVVKELI